MEQQVERSVLNLIRFWNDYCKNLDAANYWAVYRRKADGGAPEDKYLILDNTNDVANDGDWWNDTEPTATNFTVGGSGTTNSGSGTYLYSIPICTQQ